MCVNKGNGEMVVRPHMHILCLYNTGGLRFHIGWVQVVGSCHDDTFDNTTPSNPDYTECPGQSVYFSSFQHDTINFEKTSVSQFTIVGKKQSCE